MDIVGHKRSGGDELFHHGMPSILDVDSRVGPAIVDILGLYIIGQTCHRGQREQAIEDSQALDNVPKDFVAVREFLLKSFEGVITRQDESLLVLGLFIDKQSGLWRVEA